MAAPSINMALILTGYDATGRAFSSAAAGAKKTAASIRSAFSGVAAALASVGAVAGTKKALDDLNLINDQALRAGVSAEWLQRLTGAFGQFGIQLQRQDVVSAITKLGAGLKNLEKINALKKIGVDVEHLQTLNPEEAFVGFLETVAAIPDEQTRLLALMRGMEEMGLKLAPILRSGPDVFRESLQDVMGMIPAVSDSAVATATNANNALAIVSSSLSSAWQRTVAGMVTGIQDRYGDIEVVIAAAFARVRLTAENTVSLFVVAFNNIGAMFVGGTQTAVESCEYILASVWPAFAKMIRRMAGELAQFRAEMSWLYWDDTVYGTKSDAGKGIFSPGAHSGFWDYMDTLGWGIMLPLEGLWNNAKFSLDHFLGGEPYKDAPGYVTGTIAAVEQDAARRANWGIEDYRQNLERATGRTIMSLTEEFERNASEISAELDKTVRGIQAKKLHIAPAESVEMPEITGVKEAVEKSGLKTSVRSAVQTAFAEALTPDSLEILRRAWRLRFADLMPSDASRSARQDRQPQAMIRTAQAAEDISDVLANIRQLIKDIRDSGRAVENGMKRIRAL